MLREQCEAVTSKSYPNAVRRNLSTDLRKYRMAQFGEGLVRAIEMGGLLSLDYLIGDEKERLESDQSELLGPAMLISQRWNSLEREYGEGSLLAEDTPTIRAILMNPHPHSRHVTKPNLIENARKLREHKGEEWWRAEHCPKALLGKVGFHNPDAVDPEALRRMRRSCVVLVPIQKQ